MLIDEGQKGKKKDPFNDNAESFSPPFNYIHTRSVARDWSDRFVLGDFGAHIYF